MKTYLDNTIDTVNKVSLNEIKKHARDNGKKVSRKLTELFKDCAITEEDTSYLVGIIFVLESLILSEKMRDTRLTDLAQNEVENLAMELYLSMEQRRSNGNGYMEMCVVANNIIDEHLSRDQKVIK